MKNENNSKNIEPSPEDKRRLDTLTKEINERLDEVGNIIHKTLTNKSGYTVKKISFERTEKGNMVHIEDPRELSGGYYCDPPGICTPRPCQLV
jgi:hypothetical protein